MNPFNDTIYERHIGKTVVFGDLHGDIEALKSCLKTANLIDNENNWTGNNTWVVLAGDMIDRHRHGYSVEDCRSETCKGSGEIKNEEVKIQELLNKLAKQAETKNGKIIKLLGNHETGHLNKTIDPNKYSTEFNLKNDNNRFESWGPGGEKSKLLFENGGRLIVKVGDWIIVHGGIVKDIINLANNLIKVIKNNKIAERGDFLIKANEMLLKKYNKELKGTEEELWNLYTNSNNAIVWNRTLGSSKNFVESDANPCENTLRKSLELLGYGRGRIVVAHCHTQECDLNGYTLFENPKNNEENKYKYPNADVLELNSENKGLTCKLNKGQIDKECPKVLGISYDCPDDKGIGRLWRLDVAMSRGFDNLNTIIKHYEDDNLVDYWNSRKPQVLEIEHNKEGDNVRVLRSKTHLFREDEIYKIELEKINPDLNWNNLKPQ